MDSITAAIEQAVGRSYDAISREPGDYEQDGLLFCGKCRTAKQVRIQIGGRELRPLCLCRCEAERRRADDLKRETDERTERLLRLAFPAERMRNYTFEADDGKSGKAMDIAQRYVEHYGEIGANGKGLVFFGSVGNGKTYIVCCIANALIRRGIECKLTTISDAVNHARMDDRAEQIDRLIRVPMLILDDFGVERDTGYMAEQIYAVIDGRNRAKRPVILTTNLSGDELKNPQNEMNQRIYSRLYEMCYFVEVKGEDRRRQALRRDTAQFGEMLGL